MTPEETKRLRVRAVKAVYGAAPHRVAVIARWERTGEEPTETLHRSLLPMILRVYAELRKDAQKIAELETSNESLRSAARLALKKLRLTR